MPFNYSMTASESRQYMTGLFDRNELFKKKTLSAVVINQAFYYAPADIIISIAQMVEFESSGGIGKTKLEVLPI